MRNAGCGTYMMQIWWCSASRCSLHAWWTLILWHCIKLLILTAIFLDATRFIACNIGCTLLLRRRWWLFPFAIGHTGFHFGTIITAWHQYALPPPAVCLPPPPL